MPRNNCCRNRQIFLRKTIRTNQNSPGIVWWSGEQQHQLCEPCYQCTSHILTDNNKNNMPPENVSTHCEATDALNLTNSEIKLLNEKVTNNGKAVDSNQSTKIRLIYTNIDQQRFTDFRVSDSENNIQKPRYCSKIQPTHGKSLISTSNDTKCSSSLASTSFDYAEKRCIYQSDKEYNEIRNEFIEQIYSPFKVKDDKSIKSMKTLNENVVQSNMCQKTREINTNKVAIGEPFKNLKNKPILRNKKLVNNNKPSTLNQPNLEIKADKNIITNVIDLIEVLKTKFPNMQLKDISPELINRLEMNRIPAEIQTSINTVEKKEDLTRPYRQYKKFSEQIHQSNKNLVQQSCCLNIPRHPILCPITMCTDEIVFVSDFTKHIKLDHSKIPIERLKPGCTAISFIDLKLNGDMGIKHCQKLFLVADKIRDLGCNEYKDFLPLLVMTATVNHLHLLNHNVATHTLNASNNCHMIWLTGLYPIDMPIHFNLTVCAANNPTKHLSQSGQLYSIRESQDVRDIFQSSKMMLLSQEQCKLLTENGENMIKLEIVVH